IPLLERAINLCKPLSSEVLISSNHTSHTIFGYPVVEDEVKNCGPMGGIYSCLKRSTTKWNIVLSVDAVYVDQNFLDSLISLAGDFDAVVPTTSRGVEPLIALYNKSCIPVLKEKLDEGDFKMQNFLEAVQTNWFDAQQLLEKNSRLFTNLNRPEDL
ncbi:MAG TPA: molybdenum cofactor guanylyltransferase, partial [Draconibacterium sp.]|nr:molybdenum cofactor guanylyltransferase [Draconibacterium sp.]